MLEGEKDFSSELLPQPPGNLGEGGNGHVDGPGGEGERPGGGGPTAVAPAK